MSGTILQKYGAEYLERLGAEIEKDPTKSVFYRHLSLAELLKIWRPDHKAH